MRTKKKLLLNYIPSIISSELFSSLSEVFKGCSSKAGVAGAT